LPVAGLVLQDHINRMIDRRSALVAGLLLAGGRMSFRTAKAQTAEPARVDLPQIEAYLNGVHSLRAHFLQTGPDGNVTQGVALMQRPGRMRFQYDPPTPFLLVANHGILIFFDSQLNQTSNIPLSRTPLGILLADRTTLSGDVTVTKAVRLPGQIQLTLVRSASPGEGSLTLIFADNPLALRQWIVVDQQGKQTRVTFTNMEVGASVDSRLFDFTSQPSGGTGGG
jgi:outer membrane lipoprotein-sorting protein